MVKHIGIAADRFGVTARFAGVQSCFNLLPHRHKNMQPDMYVRNREQ
jgi:hypothetical protein